MKTENYICDMCKKSVGKDDLSRLEVQTRGITISQNHYHPAISFDICKECLNKKGFIINPKPEQTEEEIKKYNHKTLENKIIDILEELGVQFYE